MMKKKKPQPTSEKQPQNKPKTIRTGDGKQYKIMDSLLMNMIEDDKNQQQTTDLIDIDSEAFEVINQFMQLHREKDVTKIDLPLKSNQELKNILEEGDVLLVEKVMAKGDDYFLKVYKAACFLQVEQLKKRLMAGLAIKLMKTTVDDLKKQYGLQEYDVKQEQIREEAQKRLKFIYELKEQQ